ncbi:MAG: hypothetical protein ACMXYC_01630 [Candidatus Woesearchaeota archaeon]
MQTAQEEIESLEQLLEATAVDRVDSEIKGKHYPTQHQQAIFEVSEHRWNIFVQEIKHKYERLQDMLQDDKDATFALSIGDCTALGNKGHDHVAIMLAQMWRYFHEGIARHALSKRQDKSYFETHPLPNHTLYGMFHDIGLGVGLLLEDHDPKTLIEKLNLTSQEGCEHQRDRLFLNRNSDYCSRPTTTFIARLPDKGLVISCELDRPDIKGQPNSPLSYFATTIITPPANGRRYIGVEEGEFKHQPKIASTIQQVYGNPNKSSETLLHDVILPPRAA